MNRHDEDAEDLTGTPQTETGAIAELAQLAAPIDEFEDLALLAAHPARLSTIDFEDRLPNPIRARGDATVDTTADLLALLERFGPPADFVNVYAESANGRELTRVQAVLNDHAGPGPDLAGHGDWTISHEPRLASAVAPWLKKADGTSFGQREFAALIEDSIEIIAEPAASDLFDVVTNFAAHTSVKFSSVVNLGNGTQQITYGEDQETAAGATGNVDVPDRVTLVAPVYRGGESETIRLGLRYRADSGRLNISLRLLDPDELWTRANANYLAAVGAGHSLIMGAPATNVRLGS